MHPALRKLLYSGEFDWYDLNQRKQFLIEWARGDEEIHQMGWLASDNQGHQEDGTGNNQCLL